MVSTSTEVREDRLYTRLYFTVFCAGLLFMTAAALQFHFGKYVEYLGHDVAIMGAVLGIGTVGTLTSRVYVGRWIDTFGHGRTAIVGSIFMAAMSAMMPFTHQLWLLVVLRAIWTMSSSAVMVTITLFSADIAPPHRRAESIGTMGLSGFLGMLLGANLGDLIFQGRNVSAAPCQLLFMASAVCTVGGALLMRSCANRVPATQVHGESSDGALPAGWEVGHPTSRQFWRNAVRFSPGLLLWVSCVFSMTYSVQLGMVERFADARGFLHVRVFFLAFAPTAIALRIMCRRMPQVLGRRLTLTVGLVLMGVGLLFLAGVRTEWQLVIPGMLMGAGHCLVFPSMIDLGADPWPGSARGTGTAILLGAGDLGLLIAFIGLGYVAAGWGYGVVFKSLGGIVLITAVAVAVVWLRGWRNRRRDDAGDWQLGRAASARGGAEH